MKRLLPEAAALILVLLIVAPLMPSVMRESDQASVLHGAFDIAFRGASVFPAYFYHYDKMFGSYLVLATAFKLLPGIDPVTNANLSQFLLWSIASAILIYRGAKLPSIARCLFLATLLSPVWILNIPFFSPAAISSYTLVLAYAVPIRHWIGILAESLLTLAAVAFRADAILFLPFLFWAKSLRVYSLRSWICPRSVMIGFAGFLALLVGHLASGHLFSTAGESFTPPRIIWKVVGCFTVFALGAGVLTFFSVFGALVSVSGRRKARWFYVAGTIFFLLPLAYYAPQLLSPRYLMLTVTITVCATLNRRVAVLLNSFGSMRFRHVFAGVVLVLAIVPLGVGLDLPKISSPRVTLFAPTEYPTADGHWPMGALAGFAYGARRGTHVLIDHNQAIYNSALHTDFKPLCHEGVPLLSTPMLAILELAVDLKGMSAIVVDTTEDSRCPEVYADLRSLTHRWMHPFERDASPTQLPLLTVASSPVTNQPVVIIGPQGDALLTRAIDRFSKIFRGREIEVLFERGKTVPLLPDSEHAFVSLSNFLAEISCGGERHQLHSKDVDGLQEARYKTETLTCVLTALNPEALMARTVLPRYMRISVGKES